MKIKKSFSEVQDEVLLIESVKTIPFLLVFSPKSREHEYYQSSIPSFAFSSSIVMTIMYLLVLVKFLTSLNVLLNELRINDTPVWFYVVLGQLIFLLFLIVSFLGLYVYFKYRNLLKGNVFSLLSNLFSMLSVFLFLLVVYLMDHGIRVGDEIVERSPSLPFLYTFLSIICLPTTMLYRVFLCHIVPIVSLFQLTVTVYQFASIISSVGFTELSEFHRPIIEFVIFISVIVSCLFLMYHRDAHERKFYLLKKLTDCKIISLDLLRETQTQLVSLLLPRRFVRHLRKQLKNREDGTNLQKSSLTYVSFSPRVVFLRTDFVNFSKFSKSLKSEHVVKLLNNYYSAFDTIAKDFRWEKVKTCGDSWMAAKEDSKDIEKQAKNGVRVAIQIIQKMREDSKEELSQHPDVGIRVGVGIGSCHFCIMGNEIVFLETYGEAYNIAKFLEENGECNQIHVCEQTRALSLGSFNFHNRRRFDVTTHKQCPKSSIVTFFVHLPSDRMSLRHMTYPSVASNLHSFSMNNSMNSVNSMNSLGSLTPVKSNDDIDFPMAESQQRLSELNNNEKERSRGQSNSLKRKKKKKRELYELKKLMTVEKVLLFPFKKKKYRTLFTRFLATHFRGNNFRFAVSSSIFCFIFFLNFMYLIVVKDIDFSYDQLYVPGVCVGAFVVVTIILVFGTRLLFNYENYTRSSKLVKKRNWKLDAYLICILVAISTVHYLLLVCTNVYMKKNFYAFEYLPYVFSLVVLFESPLNVTPFFTIPMGIINVLTNLLLVYAFNPFSFDLIFRFFSFVSIYLVFFSVKWVRRRKRILSFIMQANYHFRQRVFEKRKKINEILAMNIIPEEVCKDFLNSVVTMGSSFKTNDSPTSQAENLPFELSETTFQFHFKSAVLFAEVTGVEDYFISYSENDSVQIQVIQFLNEVFNSLDEIVKVNSSVIRIKAFEHSYLVTSASNESEEEQISRISSFGLRIKAVVDEASSTRSFANIGSRVGIAYGDYDAGIIGRKTVQYDVFGSTINLASRMCTTSDVDRVQFCGGKCLIALRKNGAFHIEKKDEVVDIKGFGKLETYYLSYGQKDSYTI